MNIDEIDKTINKHQHTNQGKYGMFGLNLGVDLLDCLRKYATDKNVSMSVIVKTLVKNYLIEKGQYVQRNSVED